MLLGFRVQEVLGDSNLSHPTAPLALVRWHGHSKGLPAGSKGVGWEAVVEVPALSTGPSAFSPARSELPKFGERGELCGVGSSRYWGTDSSGSQSVEEGSLPS